MQRDETDRWLGVFRSTGLEPIGEARYDLVQAYRRKCALGTALGATFLAVPTAATALFVLVESARSEGLVLFLVLGWLVLPFFAAWLLFHYVGRWRHLRRVAADSQVEIFEGVAPREDEPKDSVSARLLKQRVVRANFRHRLVAEAESGVVLEVDGQPAARFSGGDVVTTAKLREPPTENDAGAAAPLRDLEIVELQLMRERLSRIRWGESFGASFLLGGFVYRALVRWDDLDPNTVTLITWSIILGGGVVMGLMDRGRVARVRSTTQQDQTRGLVPVAGGWNLPASELVWQRYGKPGVERLKKGLPSTTR